MILHVKKSTTIISWGLGVLAFIVVIGFMLFTAKTADAQVENGRLITVHDRGTQTAFITTKDTLGEALEERGIQLDTKDAVEPSADEKLVAPDYQVNIYRARPVTIIDGATRQKVITPYQSAERIVRDSGIALNPEDTTKLERSNDIMSDGAGLQLTIDRATPLTLNLFGAVTEVRTQAETFGELLKEKKLTLSPNDMASVSSDTAIVAGMEIRIWREGKQTINAEEAVAFGVEQIKDADRPIGFKEVQTVGQPGMRTVTYEIEIKNGVEVNRVEIASLVTKEPVKQVEVVGAKPKDLPYSGGGSKSEWLAASNIPQAHWGYADFMVQKESGWNPNAVNKSSGACGLAQALPCSKLGPNWNNPVVALNWMNNYVNGRYGGWEGAYAFWQKNRWY